MKVINLNSNFDWTVACEGIVKQVELQLSSADVGVEHCSWHAVSSERLPKLKWLFLLDELCFRVVEECHQGKDVENQDHNSEPPPFLQRQGGKNNEGSSIKGRPIQLASGGIVEPLGVYVPRAREFAKGAFLLPKTERKNQNDKLGMKAIEGLLSNEVGDEPAIFICPARLFRLPYELADALGDGEPHPDPRRNWTEIFLRMTILHEIGHYLLPAPPSASPVVSEALANSFCASLLAEDERQWLFAKAWLLQPSMYLAWFVPTVWRNSGLGTLSARWDGIVRASLGLSAREKTLVVDDIAKERWLDTPLARSGIPMSPQFRQVFRTMAKELVDGHRVMMHMHLDKMLSCCKVCDWGPFEEHGMAWNDSDYLLQLLNDGRPTVAAAAFYLLDRVHRPYESSSLDTDSVMNAACDRFLTSETELLAQTAWESERARHATGFECRFMNILKSPHWTIAAAMLKNNFRPFFPMARQEAVLREIVRSISTRTSSVRAAAAQCLADLLCEEKNGNKTAWEWLIQESNYLVYASGMQRVFTDSSVAPVDVAFGSVKSVEEAVKQKSDEEKMEYDARLKLRELIQTQQRDIICASLKFLLNRCDDSDDWSNEFQNGIEELLKTHVKAWPKWCQVIVETVPRKIRSRMLLHFCSAKEWALAAVVLDCGADLSCYYTRNTPKEKNAFYRNAFHVALAEYQVPAEIVTRMAVLPESLSVLDGDGRLPFEIAIENEHGDVMSVLMKRFEMTTKEVFELVILNNGQKALAVMLKNPKRWKLMDDERAEMYSLAKKSGRKKCAEMLIANA